ncbi:hypothetical protein CONLIGDRAFT_681533 [Coniochaeta ligniaria NRRL 30616]|uniref:Zn(2)-C6 fungal-type domain-containing protein n=1 Tax=Coniochaeta ligniaria NRRL 30616 TaxID=1408157 RepID=A0A1J7JFU2_9PEZI|nr:hypothetical protein CONLIGDRAFT_681533 [Coniochaeta ligniaria NRRL 30616]
MENTHESDAPEEERPAKRRHRSAVACQRCKSRKQRCDNDFPSCSNCLCAGEPCAYGVGKQIYPAEYVRSLESHIAQLESYISSAGLDMAVGHDHLANNKTPGTRRRESQHTPGGESTVSPESGAAAAGGLEPSLEMGVGFVALSPNSYLGTSSGFPLAKLVKSAINVTSRGGSPRKDALKRRESHSPSTNGPARKAEMPSDEAGEKLISAYFQRVHPKHPFLSRKRVLALNRVRATLVPAHQSRACDVKAGRLDYAILHLIYAAHHAAALADVDAISDVRSLENLEAMLLLSIYQLRSPTGPGIWWMIGTTMRHCLDCGLHRKSTNTSPLFDQRRKRIFWTAYMLERSVARTVGRPYTVADREIDVALPANIDDSLETDEEITSAIAESLENPGQITSLTAAIHIIQLQQLESRISKTVCRVDKPITSISPRKITKLRDSLDEWKSNIPEVHDSGSTEEKQPYLTSDYYMIQYHKALLLLFLPFLPSLTPAHPDFRQVTHSAGQICQLYKRLHDNQSYISFSLLALHANFVAGLVMVYCFCLDPSLFDTRFSSDVRACSSMLYTISERWPAARKVRSAFESLVAATIEGQHEAASREAATRGHHHPHFANHGNRPPLHQLETGGSLLSHINEDATAGNRPNDRVWEGFETVLEGYQINAETWMQDSIFLAMDAFPAEGWSAGAEIW